MSEPIEINVPTAETPPVIDGVLSPDEWDGAATSMMSDGSGLHWLYADGFLYLGINASEIGAVNLVLLREDKVWVLHSSAALGSAIYEQRDDGWQLIQDFSWCCRSRTNFSQVDQLFEVEGWRANIGFVGTTGQVEFQVALEGSEVQAALSYVITLDNVSFWPENLSEEAKATLYGVRKETDFFNPQEWATLKF